MNVHAEIAELVYHRSMYITALDMCPDHDAEQREFLERMLRNVETKLRLLGLS